MNKIIFLLFILVSCSTTTDKTLTISTGHRVVKRTYYMVEGAGDVLRKTGQATLAIWMRPHDFSEDNQDLFDFSVGGDSLPWKSRASMTLAKNGVLMSTARAGDKEELSRITTVENAIRPHQWQHVALTIDYTNKKMKFYVNGNPVPSAHEVYHFTQPVTADTISNRVSIGSEDDGSEAIFKGDLADAHVEPRIMTEGEIRELVKKTKP
ncbi:MAG: LamG domain-containing protein [Bacteriovoracaceae bacterium]